MAPQSPIVYLSNIIDQYFQDDDWSDYEELMKTIKRGSKRSVNDLLSKGYRVARPGTLNTPLHLAVERTGWTFIVKRLLESGARVDFRNAKNDTALHHAFLFEAPDMCVNSMILNYLKETNENLVNDDGLTYLHITCARSKLAFVKEFLIKASVKIDEQVNMDSKSAYAGFTALHFAVEYGKIDIAACLLKNNASVYVQDANGTTPLHLACYRRNIEMIDLLLKYDRAYTDVLDNLGTSHFVAACMSTNPYYARQYLTIAYHHYNISPMTLVNTKMFDSPVYPYPGYTPLHFAAEYGRLETVKMLLTYGAFCCALTSKNDTPLMLANKYSHCEVSNVLRIHCENHQAQFSMPVGECVPACSETITPLEAKVSIDSNGYQECQDYSSSDATVAPASSTRSCEQCVTPIDLSASNCQYNSNCEFQAFEQNRADYNV